MLSFATPLLLLSSYASAQYTATYLPSNAPPTTEDNQAGTNQCGTTDSQTSMCQNVYINAVDDFCLWAPPSPGANSTIGDTERIEVAWCMKAGYGTRLIPDGTIQGAHFVQTPDYVQVTGYGDFTKMNIPAGDEGGELDPHGADGNGNPIGGLVFGSSYGTLQQYHEWTNYMAVDQFCIRACKDGGNAPALCNHIYDLLGCDWNIPGNYSLGVFENCMGDTGPAMGVYTVGGSLSTFQQGEPSTPPAQPAAASSDCSQLPTISNGQAAAVVTSSSTSTTSSASSTSSAMVTSTSSRSTSKASTSAGAGATSRSGSASTASATGAAATSKSAAGAGPRAALGSWVGFAGVAVVGVLGGALVVL